jgi:hypothetical protein
MGGSQMQAAAYLLARESVGRPIEDLNEIRALASAAASVAETRSLLSKGRSNVAGDLQRTGHQSLYRGEVAREIRDTEYEQAPELDQLSKDAIEAAASTIVGSGYCDEHAGVSAFVHAPKLVSGDQLNLVSHRDQAHAWTQLSNSGRRSPIVMDAWSDGPPMKARDTRFGRDQSEIVEDKLSISHADAGEAAERFTAERSRLAGKWGAEVRGMVSRTGQEMGLTGSEDPVWDAPSVAHPDFAAKARVAIERAGPRATQRAMEIAANVFGLDADSAAQAAPAIVEAAKALGATASRGRSAG